MDLNEIDKSFNDYAKKKLKEDAKNRLKKILKIESEIGKYSYLLDKNAKFTDLTIEFEGFTVVLGNVFSKKPMVKLRYFLNDPNSYKVVMYYEAIYDYKSRFKEYKFFTGKEK